MEITYKRTNEIKEREWYSYTSSFNAVFDKSTGVDEFKHKYFKTITGFSYHSFLKAKEEVVGGFTIIPYDYICNNEILKIGLAVDVFVVEKFRKNPLTLYRMYNLLKNELKSIGIAMIIGIPNDIVYTYWKSLLKWEDIGCIPFYILPVKLGNVLLKTGKILNPLNKLFLKLWMLSFKNSNKPEKLFPIHIDRKNSIIEEHRYTSNYKKIVESNVFFSYRTVDEEGVNACYIIDFYKTNNKKKDEFSLKTAIRYILNNEDIDIILYVGKLGFRQLYLLKVPFKFEPKHLFFTGDIILPEKVDKSFVFNYKNWDFGLFNYDVR